MTDEERRVVWRRDFDAFGNLRADGMPKTAPGGKAAANDERFTMPLRLAGQYADEETGLYYNVHRYYDPRQRRYLTPDPVGLAGGEDGYAYVGSNPMAGVDPLGLFESPGFAFGGLGVLPLSTRMRDGTLQCLPRHIAKRGGNLNSPNVNAESMPPSLARYTVTGARRRITC